MSTNLTYTISLRDNIDTTYVTGSAIYPYYPPTSPAFSSSLENNTYYIQTDSASFTGWTNFSINSYGFRIKTPGYQDAILFAETATGLPSKPNQGVVDLGITTITRVVADTTKEVASFSNVNAEEINKATPKDEKEKGIVKLRKVLDTRGLKLKKVIVAAAVPAITQFGISNIKKLLEENDTQEKLQEAVSKLKTLCPTPEKINQLVVLKGRYEQQVVKFYESITTARNIAIPSQNIAEALNTTLQVLSAARSAGNIALAFLPLAPGAATALLNTQKEVEENLGPLLEKITKGLSLITSTFVFIAGILALINKLMTLLDILIRLCSEKLGIPYQSTNIVIAASPNLAPKTQTYKGFIFEIQLNTQQTTPYPKRYAVAKDKFNVIQLKSQESYTPNPDILIEELKFIIDRDNLSAE
jgi:hypothetical protein